MAEVLKRIFGKEGIIVLLQRILSTIPAFAAAVIWVVVSFNNIIETKLTEKMQPITNYITSKIIQDVEKQYYKIVNAPDDVKYMDLVNTIQDYCALDQQYKSPVADDQIVKIRAYYLELNKNKL